MPRLFDALTSFLDADEWSYTRIEGHTALRLGFAGDNGRWVCFARTKESERQLLFYSVCAAHAPEEKRHAIAEFLTRANYGLAIGNFELDFDDGEIRFKTSLVMGDEAIDLEHVRRLIFVNVYTMDQYLPGIMAVLFSGEDPELAVARVEAPPIDPTLVS